MGLGFFRVILAIAIVLTHSQSLLGYTLLGSELAVEAFYIISGFYMSMILNEKYSSNYLFYTNRALRLYPLYWCVLLFSVGLVLLQGGYDCDELNQLSFYKVYETTVGTDLFLLFTNLFMIGQDAVMFMGLDSSGVLYFVDDWHNTNPMVWQTLFVPQAWSVGLEILFYVIAPFIVRKRVQVILGVAVLSIIVRLILRKCGYYTDPWSYRFFPSELLLFMMGAISYKLLSWYKNIHLPDLVNKILIGILFIYTFLFSIILTPGNWVFNYWGYCLSVCLILPILFEYSRYNKFDRAIGDLSYVIYICHFFVIGVVKYIYDGQIAKAAVENNVYGLAIVILSVGFAFILKKFVQDPIDRWRWQRVKEQN